MPKLMSYLKFMGLAALIFLSGFALSLSADNVPETLSWTFTSSPYEPEIVPATVTGAPGSGFYFTAAGFTPNTFVDIFLDTNASVPRTEANSARLVPQSGTLIGTAFSGSNGNIEIGLQIPTFFTNSSFQLVASNGVESVASTVTIDSSAPLLTLPDGYSGPTVTNPRIFLPVLTR